MSIFRIHHPFHLHYSSTQTLKRVLDHTHSVPRLERVLYPAIPYLLSSWTATSAAGHVRTTIPHRLSGRQNGLDSVQDRLWTCHRLLQIRMTLALFLRLICPGSLRLQQTERGGAMVDLESGSDPNRADRSGEDTVTVMFLEVRRMKKHGWISSGSLRA